jgi:hypothetical protein
MTLSDLIEIAKNGSDYTEDPEKRGYYLSRKEMESIPKKPSIYVQWRTGGYSGGSCWGGTSERCGGESEPPFEALDELLLKVAPKISFLQYKKIEKLIKIHDYYEQGYYGNSYNYRRKYIVLEDLYNLLKEWEEIK